MLLLPLLAGLSALAGGAQVDVARVTAAVERAAPAASARRLQPPTLTQDHYTRAAGGEVVTGLERVEGSSARRAWGLAVVDAPIERVWAGVNDFSMRTEHSKVTHAEIQTGQHCADGRTIFQYLPVGIPMISDRWWVTKLTISSAVHAASDGKVREIRAQTAMGPGALVTPRAKELSQAGVPIAFSDGGWYLIALDDEHTLVEFTVWSDPGGSVSASLASSFATGGVVDNFEGLDAILAAGPRCPVE